MCECIFIKREPAFFLQRLMQMSIYFLFFFFNTSYFFFFLNIERASFVLSFVRMEADTKITVVIWNDFLMPFLCNIGSVWAGFPWCIKSCGAGTTVDISCSIKESFIFVYMLPVGCTWYTRNSLLSRTPRHWQLCLSQWSFDYSPSENPDKSNVSYTVIWTFCPESEN